MPLYAYSCPKCSRACEVFSRIAERDLPVPCVCLEPMVRVVAAPMVAGDYEGYECPRTGRWIEGRKAHTENLKRLGMRLLEPGEKDALDRRKKREEAEFMSRIEDTVGELVEAMPARKREDLAVELEHGANVEVVRRDDTPL